MKCLYLHSRLDHGPLAWLLGSLIDVCEYLCEAIGIRKVQEKAGYLNWESEENTQPLKDSRTRGHRCIEIEAEDVVSLPCL